MKQLFKFLTSACLILILAATLSSCKGGVCAPRNNPINDADSDCTADASDNCPLTYNQDQFDGDGDGVGEACDSDDTSSSEASINVPEFSFSSENVSYIFPAAVEAAFQASFPSTESCDDIFLVSCEDFFIGSLSNIDSDTSIANPNGVFGSSDGEFSINNPLSIYGRTNTSCSPHNTSAEFPPAVFCKKDGNDTFVGHLTENTFINSAIETCDVLDSLGISCR